MFITRAMAGLTAVVTILSAAMVAAPPAQAAPVSLPGDRILTAPPAPPEGSPERALATSPYTLPASTAGHVIGEQGYTCSSGHFCAVAWDPTVSKYEVFDMYYCNNYSVYYWNGKGSYRNAQTGGAVARFYNQSGTVIHTSSPSQSAIVYYWDLVYGIRNC